MTILGTLADNAIFLIYIFTFLLLGHLHGLSWINFPHKADEWQFALMCSSVLHYFYISMFDIIKLEGVEAHVSCVEQDRRNKICNLWNDLSLSEQMLAVLLSQLTREIEQNCICVCTLWVNVPWRAYGNLNLLSLQAVER